MEDDRGVQGEDGRPDEIVVETRRGPVTIRTWSLQATLKHVRELQRILAQAAKLGLLDLGADLDPMRLLTLDLATILTDENLALIYAMVSDATLTDTGALALAPSDVAAMNQFDAWACIVATWRVNVRPHLARLQGRAMQSAPLTMPAPPSVSSVLTGTLSTAEFPPRGSVTSYAPACA